MQKPLFYLHVGYPKTGTTSLQRRLYPHISRLRYLGKMEDGGPAFISKQIEALRNALNYQPELSFARSLPAYADALRTATAGAHCSLLAAEGLTNPIVDTHYLQVKDTAVKARHLASLFAHHLGQELDCHILLTIRAQANLLPAFYAQTASEGMAAGLYEKGFDGFLDFVLGDPLMGFAAYFDFDAVIALYEDLFGADRVHVFPMEALFAASPTAPQHELARLFGIDVTDIQQLMSSGDTDRRDNKRSRGPGVYRIKPAPANPTHGLWAGLRRRMSDLFRRAGFEDFIVSDKQRARIRKHYDASNRALAARRGLALAEYGYFKDDETGSP